MADLPPLLQAALQLRAETSISRLFLPAMDDNNCPPLSPAAQAVLTAATQRLYCLDPEDVPTSASEHGCAIAAALRAAADQVVPREPAKDPLWASDTYRQRADTRAYLLAIAAELEQLND